MTSPRFHQALTAGGSTPMYAVTAMGVLRLARCGVVLAAFVLLPDLIAAADFPAVFTGAPRSTVPILCTDNVLAGRTHARGTGVIVDARGTLLTAAHVVVEHQLYCDLTVLVPDNSWSRARGFRVYSVRDCSPSIELDLAVCHVVPIGRGATRLQAAVLLSTFPRAAVLVTVTGFTGWGLSPTSRTGLLRSGNFFRKQEDCYCDFSMNLTAFEGMSGGPVTTVDGQVIGIFTALGTGKFRGLAFGISIQRALRFLRHHGVFLEDGAGMAPRAK